MKNNSNQCHQPTTKDHPTPTTPKRTVFIFIVNVFRLAVVPCGFRGPYHRSSGNFIVDVKQTVIVVKVVAMAAHFDGFPNAFGDWY